jgi:hypothetical protein
VHALCEQPQLLSELEVGSELHSEKFEASHTNGKDQNKLEQNGKATTNKWHAAHSHGSKCSWTLAQNAKTNKISEGKSSPEKNELTRTALHKNTRQGKGKRKRAQASLNTYVVDERLS